MTERDDQLTKRFHHRWTLFSLSCHWVFAVGVVLQLITGPWVGMDPGWPLIARSIHFATGWTLFFVIWAYFIVHLVTARKRLLLFYPWMFARGRAMVVADLKCLISRRIPVRQMSGLAGMIEGFGLLLLIGMTLTGGGFALCYFDWHHPSTALILLSIHEYMSGFVWAYIAGHGGMALAHRYLPIRFFKEMA